MILLQPDQVFAIGLVFLGFMIVSTGENEGYGYGMIATSFFFLIFTGIASLF